MTAAGGYFPPGPGDLAEFEALIAQQVSPDAVTRAAEVVSGIPVYDMAARAGDLRASAARRVLLAEWGWILRSGPGVFVLRSALPDIGAIDAATEIYLRIIAEETATGASGADHFAASGANDRIWNSLQKLCLADPEVFARYFGAPAITAAAEAWLGPGFQMTAQVNLVHPGGAAQEAHRDYHLGFMTDAEARAFPTHAHLSSAMLTLQGGIAHCDMPIQSGPTKLLPWSQHFPSGYLAYRDPEFRAVFAQAHVQIPLAKGDALFFNPALFHAAGENRSANIARMVNLLQVSSPFGRAMEAVDRTAMCRRLYPALRDLTDCGTLSPAQAEAAIACTAEGYAFPANLDTDPPTGGLAPESQAALMRRALSERWTPESFDRALSAHAARRTP